MKDLRCIIIILTAIFHRMEADILNLQFNEQGYLTPYPVKCKELLNEFAECSANLTLCSLKHARPIRLCEKCIGDYMKFHEKYRELTTTVVNGTSCQSLFISRDRLDAVFEYHYSVAEVWSKGNCNACYDWPQTAPVLSNNTVRFYKMYNNTMECIVNTINPYANNSEEVCEKCMQTYIQLDEFYKTLSIDSIGVDSVCMDIVDSMNTTRSIWSKSLNCCKLRRSPEIIFLCCTGIISLLPLFYYLVVRYCGPIRNLPNVLKQSRFKQSILKSMNKRIN